MKINENAKVTLTLGQLKKLVKESYEHEDYGTRDLSDTVTDEEKAKIQGITDEAIEEMKNVFDRYIRNLKINAYRAVDNASAQWLFSEVYQAVKKVTKLSSGVGSTDKLERIVDEIKSLAADSGVKLI